MESYSNLNNKVQAAGSWSVSWVGAGLLQTSRSQGGSLVPAHSLIALFHIPLWVDWGFSYAKKSFVLFSSIGTNEPYVLQEANE